MDTATETRGRPQNPDTAVFVHLLNGLEVQENFKWKKTSFAKVWGLINHHKEEDREYSVRTINGIKHIFRIK